MDCAVNIVKGSETSLRPQVLFESMLCDASVAVLWSAAVLPRTHSALISGDQGLLLFRPLHVCAVSTNHR